MNSSSDLLYEKRPLTFVFSLIAIGGAFMCMTGVLWNSHGQYRGLAAIFMTFGLAVVTLYILYTIGFFVQHYRNSPPRMAEPREEDYSDAIEDDKETDF
jgi:hypothetical protein